MLTVWNVATGKISEVFDPETNNYRVEVKPKMFDFDNYMVFSGDESDFSYMRNWTRFTDKESNQRGMYQLLVRQNAEQKLVAPVTLKDNKFRALTIKKNAYMD
jgi:hypothetical protein